MERNIQIDWTAIVKEAIKRRKKSKLTQLQLAKLAGVSKPTVIKFEHQETNITLHSVFSILRVLALLKHD